MYNYVTNLCELFNEKGYLNNPGWATSLLWNYDKTKMAADVSKVREWDYYLVANKEYGVSISIAYVGTYSRMTCNFLYFKEGWCIRKNAVFNGDIHQPRDDKGSVYFKSDDAEGIYIRKPGKHIIKLHFENFRDNDAYDIDVTLDVPDSDQMVIATPFDEGPELFYYNMKHNCMKPTGKALLGDEEYIFTPDKSFAVLDYGRGVWPEQNRWYWGSGSGTLNGIDFGFNIGYGFGNLSYATENMIFYDGKAHKFDKIVFNIPETGHMSGPWTIVSNDDRFVMEFVPIFDRDSKVDLPGGKSDQHQVFGNFTGKAVLDDGTVLKIKDFFGFAEDIINDWRPE